MNKIPDYIKPYLGVGALTVLIVILLATLAHYQTVFPAPSMRSTADFEHILLRETPQLFTKTNDPIFTLSKITKIQPHWYLLELNLKTQSSAKSYVVVNDPHFGSELAKVTVGPNSNFTEKQLTDSGLPSAVIRGILDKEGVS